MKEYDRAGGLRSEMRYSDQSRRYSPDESQTSLRERSHSRSRIIVVKMLAIEEGTEGDGDRVIFHLVER